MELGLVLLFVSSTRGLAMLNSAGASCDNTCAVLSSERHPGCKSSVSGVSSWAGWKCCVEVDICSVGYIAR